MKFLATTCMLWWALADAVDDSPQVRTRKLQSSFRFALTNADSNQEIVDLTDGITVVLSDLPSTNLNVKAIPDTNVPKVQFDYDGTTNFNTEGVAPYALCGDQSGNFSPCPPSLFSIGSHTLTASATLNGAIIATRSITFTVVNSGSPVQPVPAPVPAPVPVPVPAPVPVPTPGNPSSGLPWLENFSNLPNGVQSDTGATAWTVLMSGRDEP